MIRHSLKTYPVMKNYIRCRHGSTFGGLPKVHLKPLIKNRLIVFDHTILCTHNGLWPVDFLKKRLFKKFIPSKEKKIL